MAVPHMCARELTSSPLLTMRLTTPSGTYLANDSSPPCRDTEKMTKATKRRVQCGVQRERVRVLYCITRWTQGAKRCILASSRRNAGAYFAKEGAQDRAGRAEAMRKRALFPPEITMRSPQTQNPQNVSTECKNVFTRMHFVVESSSKHTPVF